MSAPEKSQAKTITYVQAINSALHDAMEDDERVMVFGEDVGGGQGGGVFKTSVGLTEKFGELRCRSTPIAEQAIVGAAVGAAIAGMRPVAEIMLMDFIAVCMDQIVSHAAKLRFMSGGQTSVPLVIRTTCGAGVGNGGQHADSYEAWLAHVPGIKVIAPSSAAEAKGLYRSAIDDDNPCLIMDHILSLFSAKSEDPGRGYRIPLDKANVANEGKDVSIITYGRATNDALAVAKKLEGEVSVEVIDLRTVAPFDEETILKSVAKTKRAVVLHEAVKSFGVGAEISSRIHEELFSDLKKPVQRIGAKFAPVPFAKPLEEAFVYNQAEIETAIRKTL